MAAESGKAAATQTRNGGSGRSGSAFIRFRRDKLMQPAA